MEESTTDQLSIAAKLLPGTLRSIAAIAPSPSPGKVLVSRSALEALAADADELAAAASFASA